MPVSMKKLALAFAGASLLAGGTASAAQIEAYARGQLPNDSYQHNLIAQAINDHFTDLGEDHPVRYQDIPLLP